MGFRRYIGSSSTPALTGGEEEGNAATEDGKEIPTETEGEVEGSAAIGGEGEGQAAIGGEGGDLQRLEVNGKAQ